jgi:hypothetical protein
MEITLRQWIESCLSFKYISNSSIIICLIAYYTNAYSLFFILAPIVITNLILILFLEYNSLDELVNTVFNLQKATKKEVEYIKTQFVILNTLWHALPVLWLYYILNKDNLIYVFKPNFMGVFLQCCAICLIYFYFGSKNMIYGDINYSSYLILYLITLLSVSSYLYIS